MTISSIGSAFSWVPIVTQTQAVPSTDRSSALAETTSTQDRDERSGTDDQNFPAKFASERLREAASRPTRGIIVALQAEAKFPDVSAREAAAAYSKS